MALNRRGFLSGLTGVATAACSRPSQADGTYAVVETYSEIALAPDGRHCALQSVSGGVNTVLLIRNDFSEARLLALPEKNVRLRDVEFSEDSRTLLFTAGPPEFGLFDTHIRIFQLDLETLDARVMNTGRDYNRTPVVSPDGRKLAFAGRTAGGAALTLYEMDRASETVEPYSSALFQDVGALAYRSDGTLIVNGTPGRDSFHSLEIDQANGFQRVFLLGRTGDLDPSPFLRLGATSLALNGEHNDRLLLTARYDPPSGAANLRLALMDRDMASHHFIDLPDMEGRTVTGAAIARQSGLVAARGRQVGDEQGAGLLVIQGFGSAVIDDLIREAARSSISL